MVSMVTLFGDAAQAIWLALHRVGEVHCFAWQEHGTRKGCHYHETPRPPDATVSW